MIYKDKKELGAYLAGLWEGDGHITIAERGLKPRFHITFHMNNLPLVEKLLYSISAQCDGGKIAGSIRRQAAKNACVLNIWSVEGLTFVVDFVQPYLRTPKAYQISLIAIWLKRGLPQHKTAISFDDAWLAGFIDSDGSFGIEQRIRSGKLGGFVCRFRLVQRMTYNSHKHQNMINQQLEPSYKPIMQALADYFHVKLNRRNQLNTGRSYYIISVSSAQSKKILRNYLGRYALLSSKQLDYDSWCCVDDLMLKKLHKTADGISKIKRLKNSINLARTYFDWSHLNNF